MKNLLLIVVAGVLLVAIGGTGWLLLSDSNSAPIDVSPEDGLSTTGSKEAESLSGEGASGLAGQGEGAAGAQGEGREDIGTGNAPGQVLVKGNVNKPFSAPEDTELEAFALSEAYEYDEFREALIESRTLDLAGIVLDRAVVTADGSFELSFPSELNQGHIIIAGKFLYAMESQSVDLNDPQEIVFTPEVGCFIDGVLTASATDDSEASLAGIRIVVALDNFALDSRPDSRNTISCDLISDANGRFELHGLPAEYVYTLQAIPEQFAAKSTSLTSLKAGETVQVEIQLGLGGQITGRVFNPDGEPIAKAVVRAALVGATFGFEDERIGEARTNAAGEFELTGMPIGSVGIKADHPDFLSSKRIDVTVAADETTSGIEFRLDEGQELTGLVSWPDGTPAAAAEVNVRFDSAYLAGPAAFNALRGAKGDALTDDGGEFAIKGMGRGPFIVTAVARPLDLAPVTDEEPEDLSKWLGARKDSVRPGTHLEFTLHASPGIDGVVVDDKKNPLTKFTVHAVRMTPGGFGDVAMEDRHETFENPEGSFSMVDLTDGTWEVIVDSEGFVSAESTKIEVPTTEPVLFPLMRASSIAGRVLTPSGTPIANATVTVDRGQLAFRNAMTDIDTRPKVQSDPSGFFELKNLPPGSTAIYAEHEDFCQSKSAPFELPPGARLEDAELRLRAGGRLTGLVYDKTGEFAAGFMILLNSPDMQQVFSRTNSEGKFEIENIPPGHWQAIAMDSANDYSSDSDGGNSGLMGSILMSQAEILDGETTHVIIGAPPADPVTITGEVTHGGEPFAGASLIFFREGTRLYENMKFASFDEDARYSVTVDGPGNYVVFLQKMGRTQVQQQNVEFSLEVPFVEEFEHDFEVPTGRISGKVTDTNGRPAVDARVTLATDGGFRSDVLMGGQYSEVQTDSEGNYDLIGLRPGTYTIAAGGAMLLDATGNSTVDVGRVTRGGVWIRENEWKKDFNFELDAPGSAEITVIGLDGQPLAAAGIFLRDSAGRPLEPFNMAATNAAGRCLVRGLAPGDYSVMAREGLACSQESAPFRVVAGKTEKVELRLEEGTILWIKLKDSEGEDVRAALSVIDRATGRDWAAFFGMDDLKVLYLEGEFSPTEHRLGPLPPGKYKIQATGQAGSRSKPVSLRGEPERKVTLRLR